MLCFSVQPKSARLRQFSWQHWLMIAIELVTIILARLGLNLVICKLNFIYPPLHIEKRRKRWKRHEIFRNEIKHVDN